MTALYCYTGTGNTLALARRVARTLGDAVILPARAPVEQSDHGRAGFFFPIYYGGIPRGLAAFLREFPFRKEGDYFAIASYGGFALNALRDVDDFLAIQGASLRYARAIRTVANNAMLYDVDLKGAPSRLTKAEQEADLAASEIAQGIRHPPGARIPLLSRFLHYPDSDADRAFIVNRQACKQCGTCLRACVRQNIDAIDGYPLWNGNCDQCLACLHWCPVAAIDYGVRTVGRKRYHHPDVALEDLPR